MSERAVEHDSGGSERAGRAASSVAGGPVAAVERLQRSAGNAAVTRLLQRDDHTYDEAGKRISSEPGGNPDRYDADEVLAEAFARFHTDPSGLKTGDAATHAFVSGGSHLKQAKS